MKNFILCTIYIMVLSGCGNSEVREFRGQFMEGCLATSERTSRKENICECSFKKLHDKVGDEGIVSLKHGNVPPDLGPFLIQAGLSCTKENS